MFVDVINSTPFFLLFLPSPPSFERDAVLAKDGEPDSLRTGDEMQKRQNHSHAPSFFFLLLPPLSMLPTPVQMAVLPFEPAHENTRKQFPLRNVLFYRRRWKRSHGVHGIPAGTPERVSFLLPPSPSLLPNPIRPRSSARGKLDEIMTEANAKDAPLIISIATPLSPVHVCVHFFFSFRPLPLLWIFSAACAQPRGKAQLPGRAEKLNYMLPAAHWTRALVVTPFFFFFSLLFFSGPGEKKLETDPPAGSRQRLENRERY